MGRTEFIDDLRVKLSYNFSSPEIKDILTDYDGFFETGLAEGKTETEICAELGVPSQIARELAEEKVEITLAKKPKRNSVIVFPFLQSKSLKDLVLSVLSVTLLVSSFLVRNKIRVSIFLSAVISVLMWFTLGGKIRSLPVFKRSLTRNWEKAIARRALWFNIIPALFAITLFTLFIADCQGNPGERDYFLTITFIVPFRNAYFFLAAIMMCLAVYGFFRFSEMFFPVLVNLIGFTSFYRSLYTLLEMLIDDVDRLTEITTKMFCYTYGASLIFTALSAVYITILRRKGRR